MERLTSISPLSDPVCRPSARVHQVENSTNRRVQTFFRRQLSQHGSEKIVRAALRLVVRASMKAVGFWPKQPDSGHCEHSYVKAFRSDHIVESPWPAFGQLGLRSSSKSLFMSVRVKVRSERLSNQCLVPEHAAITGRVLRKLRRPVTIDWAIRLPCNE